MNKIQEIQTLIGTEADGSFGPKSRAALAKASPEVVKQVQHVLGVKEDGNFGPQSQAALDSLIGFANPVLASSFADRKDHDRLWAEYQKTFNSTEVKTNKIEEVNNFIARLARKEPRYRGVSATTGVPWYVIGLIHGLEADFDFTKHLHNGDPLTRRTVQVPAGRPKKGNPPFTWEESAVDALEYDGFTNWKDWSIPGTLYMLEKYNGWGYRDLQKQNPYLWSYSNHYVKGKYTSDGHYDPDKVSGQVGAATALFQMIQQKLVQGVS